MHSVSHTCLTQTLTRLLRRYECQAQRCGSRRITSAAPSAAAAAEADAGQHGAGADLERGQGRHPWLQARPQQVWHKSPCYQCCCYDLVVPWTFDHFSVGVTMMRYLLHACPLTAHLRGTCCHSSCHNRYPPLDPSIFIKHWHIRWSLSVLSVWVTLDESLGMCRGGHRDNGTHTALWASQGRRSCFMCVRAAQPGAQIALMHERQASLTVGGP